MDNDKSKPDNNLERLCNDQWWENFRRRNHLAAVPERTIQDILLFLNSHKRFDCANDS